jgi:hypothetical protein
MRKQLITGLLATAALLAIFVPSAAAAPGPAADGEAALSSPSPTGYYIWHSDDGWHLQTHGPATEHLFDAVLRTDGTFENVDVARLESDDSVNVVDGGKTMLLHFHTYGGDDRVNFTVRDGTRVHCNLKIDGSEAPTTQIFLGESAHNPDHNPFNLKL